jgi:hypothetical protein
LAVTLPVTLAKSGGSSAAALPFTGIAVGLVALIGALMLAFGLAQRRLVGR